MKLPLGRGKAYYVIQLTNVFLKVGNKIYILFLFLEFQCLFERVVGAIENGGKLPPCTMQLGYTKEQVDAIQRLKNAKNDWERLGLYPGASKYVSLVDLSNALYFFIKQNKNLSF